MLNFIVQYKGMLLFILLVWIVINFFLKRANFILKLFIFLALAIFISTFLGIDLSKYIDGFASSL